LLSAHREATADARESAEEALLDFFIQHEPNEDELESAAG
jgi:hypothetical protein